MKLKYINNKSYKFSYVLLFTAITTFCWGQRTLTGGTIGTSSDVYVVNSDETANDSGIRLQTSADGERFIDWVVWTDDRAGELNFSSFISTTHTDADEIDPGVTHLSIDPVANTTNIEKSLFIGSDLATEVFRKNDADLNVFGATYISEKGVLPNGFNVGTYADDYLLWVEKGIITIDFAIVNAEHWSDHVFKEEYVLKDLDALEEFIKKNGHLPNIPSEEEVLKEGYNIHDMNALFLEKIEELTLYSIEQNKKINALLKAQRLEDQIEQNKTNKN